MFAISCPSSNKLLKFYEDASFEDSYIVEMLAMAYAEESHQDGAQRLLITLLRTKFGTLSETTISLIQQGSMKQVEFWAERMLYVNTLEEVFHQGTPRESSTYPLQDSKEAIYEKIAKFVAEHPKRNLERMRQKEAYQYTCDQFIEFLGSFFGPLSEPLITRIRQSNVEQLEYWTIQTLTAHTLEEIFDDSSSVDT